ncbi:MAG: CoA-binding protein, partial [Chloroflexi bacterium]|nr:CoA-binding protein [Chloroflexota bacterium]
MDEKNGLVPLAVPDIGSGGLGALDALFAPKFVAVIGAKETQGVERTVLANLVNNPFGGTVFPIHAREHSILGIKTYPSITSTPDPVDLAVIVSAAAEVPRVIGEC